jgi:hypothetical protein
LGGATSLSYEHYYNSKYIEDAMDEIPDNIRIWGKTRDELVIALEALNL